MRRHDRRGTTLLELVLVLSILSVLLGAGGVAMERARDEVAARAARDALAGALARTRSVAVARGGARLVLDLESGRGAVVPADADTVLLALDLAGRWRVRVSADGRAGSELELPYDGYGIGRMASRTLRLRRRGAEARLTVSSYGRVRRW